MTDTQQYTHFDKIMPHIMELEGLLLREDVTEIMVNADGSIYFEANGALYREPGTISEARRQTAVKVIARLLKGEVSENSPLLDARLPDGSRVSAALPPVSVGGTVITIRKFRHQYFTANELVNRGMLTGEVLDILLDAIDERKNILISGATGSGKSTLLAALAAYMPSDTRVVLIEDTAELSLIGLEHQVRLEAKKEQAHKKAVSMRTLVKHALRMRPDRMILGEVRGSEAFDLITALNTGHQGSLSTIHANSALQSLSRLRTLASMASKNLSDRSVARMIVTSIDIIVHVARIGKERKVVEVARMKGFHPDEDDYSLEVLA